MKTRIRAGTRPGLCEGGALLLVLVVLLAVNTLGMGLMSLGRQAAIETANQLNRYKAFWLADAGVKQFAAIISAKPNLGTLERLGLVDENGGLVLQGGFGPVGSFGVRVAGSATHPGRYLVRSAGLAAGGNAPVTVSSMVRPATGSENVWTTQSEQGIWFVTGDAVKGPAHTNDKYYINGKPVFEGKASSSESTVRYNDGARGGANSTYVDPDVFTAGLDLGVPEADFDSSLVSKLRTEHNATVLNGSYEVVLLGQNYALRQITFQTVWIRRGWRWIQETVKSYGPASTNAIAGIGMPTDDDNILYFTGDVEVKGEVGGRVSVASDQTIRIVDNLVYSSAPTLDHGTWASGYAPANNEALGLYSKRKVEVDFDSPFGRPVNIHAAIFVAQSNLGSDQNPGFGTADRYEWLNSPYINLYGSIMQHDRGVVGRTNGQGYLKNYRYDPRFRNKPPPGAPPVPPKFSRWSVLS